MVVGVEVAVVSAGEVAGDDGVFSVVPDASEAEEVDVLLEVDVPLEVYVSLEVYVVVVTYVTGYGVTVGTGCSTAVFPSTVTGSYFF